MTEAVKDKPAPSEHKIPFNFPDSLRRAVTTYPKSPGGSHVWPWRIVTNGGKSSRPIRFFDSKQLFMVTDMPGESHAKNAVEIGCKGFSAYVTWDAANRTFLVWPAKKKTDAPKKSDQIDAAEPVASA